MKYLLDTNSCIAYLNDRDSVVARRLTALDWDDAGVCSVVKAELYYGAYKSSRRAENLALLQRFFEEFESVAFDDRAADEFGKLRARLAAQGKPIGPYDLMIAAIALANNLTLVSHNTREFGRVEGLRIEDWEEVPK